jgi:hypothetical protein
VIETEFGKGRQPAPLRFVKVLVENPPLAFVAPERFMT